MLYQKYDGSVQVQYLQRPLSTILHLRMAYVPSDVTEAVRSSIVKHLVEPRMRIERQDACTGVSLGESGDVVLKYAVVELNVCLDRVMICVVHMPRCTFFRWHVNEQVCALQAMIVGRLLQNPLDRCICYCCDILLR